MTDPDSDQGGLSRGPGGLEPPTPADQREKESAPEMENERHGGLFVMSTTRFSTSASTSPVQWRLVLVDLAPLMLPACL